MPQRDASRLVFSDLGPVALAKARTFQINESSKRVNILLLIEPNPLDREGTCFGATVREARLYIGGLTDAHRIR
jgi:hypothetical protein